MVGQIIVPLQIIEKLPVGVTVVRVRFEVRIVDELAVIAATETILGDQPEYWQALGIVFTGKGFGDVDGVRFFDLNGDGREDWLWVDDTGITWTYTNNHGCKTDTLEPLWRPGSNVDGGDYTHAGMGHYVGRDAIYFAKVCRVPEAFSLSGRADYIWISTSFTQTTSSPGLGL